MRQTLEKFHPGGHEELVGIATELGTVGVLHGENPASREDTSQGPVELPFIVVPPRVLLQVAPWIEDLYHGPFLEAARKFGGTNVTASEDVDNYPLINIHPIGKRYETHVDTNPYTGLYFLGEHDRTPETGGALVVSKGGDVHGLPNLLVDCERYYPVVGELAIMNGFNITHAVEPSIDHPRMMLVSNFWTPAVPESARGVGLDTYQLGRAAS